MKRSVTIDGHPTSISLEEEFWRELRAIADADGVSLARLVTRIDAERWASGKASRGLSSTLRVFVLQRVKTD